MTLRTDQDMLAEAGFMTSASLARQLGEAICAKTQAEAQTGVFHAEIMTLRGQLDDVTAEAAAYGVRIDQLHAQLAAAGLGPAEGEAAAGEEPHAVDHPDEDPGVPGSAAMLHPAGAPAAHPDAVLGQAGPGADAVLDHAP